MTEGVGNAVLVEIAKRIIQPVADATVRQFIYLFCYQSNINKLNKILEELKLTREDAKSFWDSSANNNEETSHIGTAWLDKVKAAETAANDIKEAIDKPKTGCLSNWCPNPKKRYLLSRNAVKKAKEIQQLQIKGKDYVPSTKPALPPSKLTGALANDGSKDFKTRSKIMDDILGALKDEKICIVGVCGSGGVGKTTLMHELRETVKLNDLFYEVAMITVTRKLDLSVIRFKLAEMLGLSCVKDKKNEIAVADEIHKRLTGKGRRTLVILDDIWNEMNLEELGIPVEIDQMGCKVVLVSRQLGVCVRMKASKTISVAVMPPEEAWYLFRKTAGDCVESDDLKEIAKKVAGECGGLPIALVTLAKALSNKDVKIWKDAHYQLREHSVTRIPDMDKNVYSSIKMSFDFSASEQPESMPLLLLCCQHSEDAAIKVENLARYCVALRLFKNVDTLEDVKNIVFSLIEYLKSCFLLETMDAVDECDSYEMVRVHDIIRDVGLKEERNRVSMKIVSQANNDVYKLGTSEPADIPNLKVLVQTKVDGGLLNKSFLSQMEELKVLEYRPNDRDHRLPAIEGLTNMRMLSLEYATLDVETLSKIGRLTKLEFLSLRDCSKIGPFPRSVCELSNLKLLDLRSVYGSSHPIPRGILQELSKLEELYFGDYFFSEDGAEGESHGRIAELEKLSNLKILQIKLLNPMKLLDLHLGFEKLQRFSFGTVGSSYWFSTFRRTLIFSKVSVEWISGCQIESIVTRTEQLQLRGVVDWTDPLKIEKFASLRELELRSCEHLEYLISDVGGDGDSSVFRKLENLKLYSMSGLTELCHNGYLKAGSLGKLRRLCLFGLPKLRHLWVGPTDSLCLVNVTKVEIIECGALECIFPHSAAKCLVQLQILSVSRCLRLNGIVSKGEQTATGIEDPTDLTLHFPKLRKVTIIKSAYLWGFYNIDLDSRVQSLFSPLVMLPSMEDLQISGSDQLKHIVTYGTIDIPNFTVSDWLQNLEDIYVESCASLESVFDFEGIQCLAENAHVVTLGKLLRFYLKGLPNLTSLFRCKMQDISLPQLQAIFVFSCHKLKNLVTSNLIKFLHSLKKILIENCETLETVFDFEGLEVMGEETRALFGKLQEINLTKLPKLEHVCWLAPKEIHVFQNLRNLSVENCSRLVYLFSSSMARMFEKLESLTIRRCKSICEGITMNEEHVNVKKKIVFGSLSTISLVNLKKLSSLCSNEQLEFEFPSLDKVFIKGCPELKTFCYGRVTTEKLHSVNFASRGSTNEWKGDLNQTVQHFNAIRDLKTNDHVDEDEDDDDDDSDDEDDDDSDDENDDIEDDINGSAQQLNTRVNRISSDLKQDGARDYSAKDFDDIHVREESVHDEYIHCSNEETVSHPMKALVSDNYKDLAFSTSPSQKNVAFPRPSDSQVQHVNSSLPEDHDDDEQVQFGNEGTLPELTTDEFHPNASEDVLTTSTGRPLHINDTSMKTKAEEPSSDSSSKSFVEFQEFIIIVNGCIIDSQLSNHLQAKYYELCCTRKCYLHQRLHNGINHTLAAQIISQIIDITDAIRACKLSTCMDKITSWDKSLEAFEMLGMEVGFIRARLKRLEGIAKQYEIMFLEEANAEW